MQCGEIIKFLRTKNDLTQEEMAELLGVKKSSIQKYESGAVSNLKMETIRTICEKFNVSPFILVFPEKITTRETALKFHVKEDDMQHVFNLNEVGLQKVIDYLKDLNEIAKYRR